MRDDIESDTPFQFGRAASVIVMAVSKEQVFYPLRIGPAFPDVCEKPLHRQAAPGIHQSGFLSEFYEVYSCIFRRGKMPAAHLENLARYFHGRKSMLPKVEGLQTASIPV
jgi:hypothetical protein